MAAKGLFFLQRASAEIYHLPTLWLFPTLMERAVATIGSDTVDLRWQSRSSKLALGTIQPLEDGLDGRL
jgi:hypothetical protein